MKVAQEIDVDNVTIIINPQNKLEAKIPTSTPSEVVIEEVPNVTPANKVVTLNGTDRKIVKLGKVNGTEWLVFQLETPKPTINKNIRIEFYDDVGTDSELGGAGAGYNFTHTGKIRVTTEDGSPFTPNDTEIYERYEDLNFRLEINGSTESKSDVISTINFHTMTYQARISYRSPQTSSTLTNVNLNGYGGFTAEHDDAIYNYITSGVSFVQNTRTLPTFTVSSRGSDNEIYVDRSKTVTNSEGVVRFEFDTDMSAYATAGYKVYGVIKNNEATIYEAPLDDTNQRIALGSGNTQYSEISHGWLQGIVGKTLNSLTNLTAHVYLMNDAGDKVYPANQPDGYVGSSFIRTMLALD